MKVLWFEITRPSRYQKGKAPIGGWQDSLERIMRTEQNIQLYIAFITNEPEDILVDGNVTYIPIYFKRTFAERLLKKYWDVFVQNAIPKAVKVVNDYKPDVIQVFGVEYMFGQIAAYTDIPVVAHIQGAAVPYMNAYYPPGISKKDWFFYIISGSLRNPFKLVNYWKTTQEKKNWVEWEKKTWQVLHYYMGRTKWDEALSEVMHPSRCYYHVDEALREEFFDKTKKWQLPEGRKIRIVSTGCGSFWKGPDMLLKVAGILKDIGINFEWIVAGRMDNDIRRFVEKRVGRKFKECNINLLGYIKPDELSDLLCHSSLYVHTAYIENSPNSICEAQIMGVPVVSTNVGGISSLIRDGIDGDLVAANDPWQMAFSIVSLSRDQNRMLRYSASSRSYAQKRHSDDNIREQLLDTYENVIKYRTKN